jgi:hypothetical protein
MRLVRTPPAALALFAVAASLSSCFGHHTSDELVLKNATAPNEGVARDDEGDDIVAEDDNSAAESARQDAGTRPAVDAGTRPVDAGAMQCNQTDAIERVLCTAGLGGSGGIDSIINGILGGGMTGMDASCARETDPVARALCGALGGGGTGLEGIIGSLLGGGGVGAILTDGGIERVLTNAIVEVARGVIDDLLTSLFGGNRDAGTGNARVDAGRAQRLLANTKSADVDDLVRSAEQCSRVSKDDLLTRLVCARQALDTLSSAP